MTQTAKTVDYRVAVEDDETDILAVLEEVAPEVPVLLDTPGRQNAIQNIIIECRESGKSLVAVEDGKVIGFVLARPDLHEQKAISLRYIGVSADARERGIFKTLMQKLKANGTPLTASVLDTNKSDMVGRLAKSGFTKVGFDAKETKWRWAPPIAPRVTPTSVAG